MRVTGILSVAVGAPYVLRLFGPTEAEVVQWGQLAVEAGLISLALSWPAVVANARVILVPGYAVLGLMQLPPIALWFLFHGSPISDPTPRSDFVAHWSYSLPHMLLAACAFATAAALHRADQRE